MSLNKDKKEKLRTFMDAMAKLMSEHDISLGMDGGLCVEHALAGYLEQNYDSLDLLDQDEVPVYSVEIPKKD